ncbi:hypothetical protein BJX66DRAFT_306352 [Aspergillus keveii]|uniref:Uncharacterized protein n=1 Tax=Aspergillus keveii TaxID=714993 RepID=A0ABR4G2K7_9EURO
MVITAGWEVTNNVLQGCFFFFFLSLFISRLSSHPHRRVRRLRSPRRLHQAEIRLRLLRSRHSNLSLISYFIYSSSGKTTLSFYPWVCCDSGTASMPDTTLTRGARIASSLSGRRKMCMTPQTKRDPVTPFRPSLIYFY